MIYYSNIKKAKKTYSLRGIDTLSREATLKEWFCLPSEKGVYSKRKEFAPFGSKFFPFRADCFSEKGFVGKHTGSHQKLSPL